MAIPREHQPVQFFCGVIFAPGYPVEKVEHALETRFGAIDFQSSVFDFAVTQCYEKEMGSRLSKVFYAFEDLWAPGHLVRIKLETNGLETQALRDFDPGRDGRIVNIDPGYVEYAKMVLASAKNGANRIYLEQGIFAESTLYFVDGTFHAWPRTYPDYKTEEYIAFFNELRKRYCEKSRNNREWREPLLFQ